MEKISLEEMNWLIENGYLKQVKGKYPDLKVCGKHHRKSHKQRQVPPTIYDKLKLKKD